MYNLLRRHNSIALHEEIKLRVVNIILNQALNLYVTDALMVDQSTFIY